MADERVGAASPPGARARTVVVVDEGVPLGLARWRRADVAR